MPKIALVVAATENNVIGKDGTMPWHLPEDLRHFKEVTAGGTVIMGRTTWESLPSKFRPLPGRRNLVLTSQKDYNAPGAELFESLDAALAACENEEIVFIIGGGSVYRQAIARADIIHLTRIHAVIEGDTTFPDIPAGFKVAAQHHSPATSTTPALTFMKLERG